MTALNSNFIKRLPVTMAYSKDQQQQQQQKQTIDTV